jgi:hypothetical protein
MLSLSEHGLRKTIQACVGEAYRHYYGGLAVSSKHDEAREVPNVLKEEVKGL